MEFPLQNAKLRPWTLNDAPSLCLHANNIKIASFLRNAFPYPYTLKDAISWLQSNEDNPNLLMAICVNNVAVGGIGIIHNTDIYRKSAEIGYWLSEDYWNKGIMTDAIKTLTDYSFSNLGLIRIYAGIFETNKASARVLIKAGFDLEAIHKQAVVKNQIIMDEHIYAKFKSKK